MDKESGQMILPLGIIIFLTVAYVVYVLIASSVGCPSAPAGTTGCVINDFPTLNTTMGNNFPIKMMGSVYDQASCANVSGFWESGTCFFTGLAQIVVSFVNWIIFFVQTLYNYAMYVFGPNGLIYWIFRFVFDTMLFAWIWSGPFAFPYPVNFIVGLPLTMMSVMLILEIVIRILSVVKGWIGGGG